MVRARSKRERIIHGCMAIVGTNLSKIATELGYSITHVQAVVSGHRRSDTIESHIEAIIERAKREFI